MINLKILIIIILLSVNIIARECPNGELFCSGIDVISTQGRPGRIVGSYQDGDVAVRFSIFSKSYKWPISKLALRSGCTQDNYCVGDEVFNAGGYPGTIKGIFQSGNVAVNFSRFINFPGRSKFYIYSTSNLAFRDN